MVSSIAVANEFIRLGKENAVYFTPMQILKLVYIAHGWTYAFFNKPLIDDRIEAWKYGPVIPDLYRKIKSYGNGKIEQEIHVTRSLFNKDDNDLTEDEEKVIKFVYKKYGKLDGIDLSMITHQAGTPWSETFDSKSWGDIIPNSVIHSHYKQLLEKITAEYNKNVGS